MRKKPSRIPTFYLIIIIRITYNNGRIIFNAINYKYYYNYNIETNNRTRRNSVVRNVARFNVARNFTPAVIFRTLLSNNNRNKAARIHLRAAGGSHITRQNIINARHTYRQSNPNLRRVRKSFLANTQIDQIIQFINSSSSGRLYKSLTVER